MYAQIELKGKINEKISKEAIEGALIIAKSKNTNNISVVTNKKGEFFFSDYYENDTLLISHISYETFIIVPKSEYIVIELVPKNILIDDIVITGSKAEISRENVPLSVSVIDKIKIEESGESALLPVISENIPGIFITERGVTGFGVAGGAAGQISIRGVGGSPNTQILMLLDGHPQYMGIMGHPLPDSYVASDVDKVEIIKGPASILYGSGAMGGVINIITRKQKKDGLNLNGKMVYGSYNTQKYMAGVGYRKGRFRTFASFNHDLTDGHRVNSSFSINNGYFKIEYNVNKNIKTIADFNLAKFKTFDPGPTETNDSTYITNPHWIDIKRGKAALSVENNYESFKGAFKLFYNFGEHKIYDGFHSNDINTGFMIYQTLELFKNNTITTGIDYKKFGGIAENTFAMRGEGLVFGDTTLNELGVYVITQQQLFDKLSLTAGIRSENHSVYGNEWIPQAGFSYRANYNTTIKSVVSKGFRSPTIRELYLWAPANEDLEPERLMNYEISWLQKLNKKLNFEISCFLVKGSNLIKTIFEGGIPKHVNTGEFNNSGIEFLANFNMSDNLRFHINYSYLHMKQAIIASPEHQGYLSVKYKWKKFSFAVNTQYINNLYTSVLPGKEVKQSYSLLHARINYRLNKYIDIHFNGKNLLNAEYEINYLYPMPGITFFAGLNFHINNTNL